LYSVTGKEQAFREIEDDKKETVERLKVFNSTFFLSSFHEVADLIIPISTNFTSQLKTI